MAGKAATTVINPSYAWLLVGDSHLSLLGPTISKIGSSLVAIRGGHVLHVDQYFYLSKILVTSKVDAVVISIGGNDMTDENVGSMVIAHQLMGVIKKIQAVLPQVLVVTTTIWPRAFLEVSKTARFLDRIDEFDHHIQAQGPTHHHLVTDAFIADTRTNKGPALPQTNLFARDRTHLNFHGRELLEIVFSYIFESIAQGNFDTAREINFQGMRRLALWKF